MSQGPTPLIYTFNGRRIEDLNNLELLDALRQAMTEVTALRERSSREREMWRGFNRRSE